MVNWLKLNSNSKKLELENSKNKRISKKLNKKNHKKEV